MLTIYSSHDKADLCGVCRTCEMCVDLLRLVLVEGDEAVQNVVAGLSVILTPLIVGEVILHRRRWELLLEAINLVQEQDDGCLDEPPGIADGIEQGECLLHAVDGLIFEEKLVVLGNGDQEENRGHVLEAMDPLLSL